MPCANKTRRQLRIVSALVEEVFLTNWKVALSCRYFLEIENKLIYQIHGQILSLRNPWQFAYQKNIAVAEGKNKIDLDVENLPSGVYFASLKTGASTISKKFIIN